MELTPKTRKEVFLAAAGGQDVTTPTPITREEVFLDEIAKGGGGSSVGPLIVNVVDDTLDKTWQEIHDAILTRGAVAYYADEDAVIGLILAYPDGGKYYIETISGAYAADTTDDYPSAAS